MICEGACRSSDNKEYQLDNLVEENGDGNDDGLVGMGDGTRAFSVVAEQVVVQSVGGGYILTSLDVKVLRKNVVTAESAPASSRMPASDFCKMNHRLQSTCKERRRHR